MFIAINKAVNFLLKKSQNKTKNSALNLGQVNKGTYTFPATFELLFYFSIKANDEFYVGLIISDNKFGYL